MIKTFHQHKGTLNSYQNIIATSLVKGQSFFLGNPVSSTITELMASLENLDWSI